MRRRCGRRHSNVSVGWTRACSAFAPACGGGSDARIARSRVWYWHGVLWSRGQESLQGCRSVHWQGHRLPPRHRISRPVRGWRLGGPDAEGAGVHAALLAPQAANASLTNAPAPPTTRIQERWLTKQSVTATVVNNQSTLAPRKVVSVTIDQYVKNTRAGARRKRKHTEMKRLGIFEVRAAARTAARAAARAAESAAARAPESTRSARCALVWPGEGGGREDQERGAGSRGGAGQDQAPAPPTPRLGRGHGQHAGSGREGRPRHDGAARANRRARLLDVPALHRRGQPDVRQRALLLPARQRGLEERVDRPLSAGVALVVRGVRRGGEWEREDPVEDGHQ